MSPLDMLLAAPQHPRAACIGRGSVVPAARGIYGWWFECGDLSLPTSDCLSCDGRFLLYLGISPDSSTSGGNLRKRIGSHFTNNASGSTLRKSLGTLLAAQSGLPLRRVPASKPGKPNRVTLTHEGEQWLDRWLDLSARVAFIEHPEPWTVEEGLLQEVSCPLNLDDNAHHPFHGTLSSLRRKAMAAARLAPIASEVGWTRAGRPVPTV